METVLTILNRVCLTSILRLYYTRKFVEAADETYWQAFLGAWLYLEVAVGIIVGCMPTFPKFAQHIRHRWKEVAAAKSSSTGTNVLREATKRQLTDPYDVHRHLNESALQLQERSVIELNGLKSKSTSIHDSIV